MAVQNQAPNSAPVPTTRKDYVTVVARHKLGGRIRPVAYPWNERLWITQLETATVCRNGRIEFCFKNRFKVAK